MGAGDGGGATPSHDQCNKRLHTNAYHSPVSMYKAVQSLSAAGCAAPQF